jgi:hypothetical protein
VNSDNRIRATEWCCDDFVPALRHDVEENPIAIGAVGLSHEFSCAKDLMGIMQGLVGVMNRKHLGCP